MQYLRCKCGKVECWSSMGTAPCEGCTDCNTTLATHPHLHKEPVPHDWKMRWDIDHDRGLRWRERQCTRCFKKEKL